MLLSCKEMKRFLQLRCDGSHDHEPLEGGQRTKRAQQWPEDMCKGLVHDAMEEMRRQVMKVGFAAEYELEEMQEHGTLDGIYTLDDVEEPAAKRQRINLDELDREEEYEEMELSKEDELVAQKEKNRREGWLKISKDQRVALRRLHYTL